VAKTPEQYLGAVEKPRSFLSFHYFHSFMHRVEPFDEHGRSLATQRYEHARTLMDKGALEQAAVLFQQAAIESPHFKTYELLGECYLRMGRFAEAIPFLAAASFLNNGVKASSLLAEAWLALGRHSDAGAAVEIALSRDPKNKLALKVREQLERR
jgi:tetratricopeptide (TPR) repeat protein